MVHLVRSRWKEKDLKKYISKKKNPHYTDTVESYTHTFRPTLWCGLPFWEMLTKAMGRVPRKMNNLFGTYFPFLAFAADLLHRGRMIGGLALWWGLIGLTTHSTPYHALSISAFNLFLFLFFKKILWGWA